MPICILEGKQVNLKEILMQVSGATSRTQQYPQLGVNGVTPPNSQTPTDEFLFAENNNSVQLSADIQDPSKSSSAPAIIGAMLSAFADEVISFLGASDSDSTTDVDDDANKDKIPSVSGSTNYVA